MAAEPWLPFLLCSRTRVWCILHRLVLWLPVGIIILIHWHAKPSGCLGLEALTLGIGIALKSKPSLCKVSTRIFEPLACRIAAHCQLLREPPTIEQGVDGIIGKCADAQGDKESPQDCAAIKVAGSANNEAHCSRRTCGNPS